MKPETGVRRRTSETNFIHRLYLSPAFFGNCHGGRNYCPEAPGGVRGFGSSTILSKFWHHILNTTRERACIGRAVEQLCRGGWWNDLRVEESGNHSMRNSKSRTAAEPATGNRRLTGRRRDIDIAWPWDGVWRGVAVEASETYDRDDIDSHVSLAAVTKCLWPWGFGKCGYTSQH